MPLFSIRTRLIFILCIILISGFLLTNVISYNASKASVRSSIINSSLPLSRDTIYSEIQKDLTRPIYVSSLMANDTFLKDWVLKGETSYGEIQKYLGEIQEKYGFFSAFFVSDKTLNYYHFNGILKQVSPEDNHDVWYYSFKESQRNYVLDVDTNQAAQNHLTIFINHRLHGYNGEFLGVVGVGLNFDKVSQLLGFYNAKYQRSVYMTDSNGLIQVHTDKSKIETLSIKDIPGLNVNAPAILKAVDTPVFFEYDTPGQHRLLTSRYVKELNWFLLVEQDETLALKSIHDTFVKNFIISLVITLTTVAFASLTINHFQKKLEQSATRDKLTQAYNRREFERRFHYYTAGNRRQRNDMCILIFDIDFLKTLNDQQGHLFGDHVIRTIAQIAQASIREHDLLVRWGGDEFVLLLFSTPEQSWRVAQRMQASIAGTDFYKEAPNKGEGPRITVSCGLAQIRPEDSLDTVLARADQALYKAKHFGKNRIISSD